VNIVFLSTYPPAPCGIGDYTRELRHAVERASSEVRIEVVAERHPQVVSEWDERVERAWDRQGSWDTEAARVILGRRPALVHIQHEEAILHQNAELIRFLKTMEGAKIRTVVTLHSVYAGRLGLPNWWPPPLFHRAVAAHCDAIVVHQENGGRDTLLRQGVAAHKIHVIPHGTILLERVEREAARLRLNIPVQGKVALFFGVIHPKKNLDTALAASARVAARVPGFCFVIAGKARERSILDTIYVRRLQRRMQVGLTDGWLDVRNGLIPSDQLSAYLAAADVVLFPHDQSYGSASGVFHLALGAGRAAICSSSPKFGEARPIFGAEFADLIVPARDADAWATAITSMLSNPERRERAEARAERAAIQTSWSSLAGRYVDLYRSLVAASAPG